ncbi:MAG: c-type cytochrome biogenesis protein CcmI [Pseudomonadales bacterium]
MIEFWGAIALLTLVALGFVGWPLLSMKRQDDSLPSSRKTQNVEIFKQRVAELEEERDAGLLSEASLAELTLELEKNLLLDAQKTSNNEVAQSRLTGAKLALVAAVSVLVISVSLAFYSRYGSYDELVWFSQQHASGQQLDGQQPTAEQAIAMLERELQQNPDNAEGWYILASAYIGTNQFVRASEAFEKVLQVLPEEAPQRASVTGQYAQALYFIAGKVSADVSTQVEKALSLDANEVVSLGLMGIAAYDAQDYQGAIDHWSKAMQHADASASSSLQSGIAKARSKLGVEQQSATGGVPHVSITLDVDADVREQVDPQAVVFVFARPIGGGIPLAAKRLTVAELPVNIILDDSLAMMEQAKISLQNNVEVSARISLGGTPQAVSGDYTADAVQAKVSESGETVNLLIDRLVD